jgi:hypothetical protein
MLISGSSADIRLHAFGGRCLSFGTLSLSHTLSLSLSLIKYFLLERKIIRRERERKGGRVRRSGGAAA